jgi:hypothetical protein
MGMDFIKDCFAWASSATSGGGFRRKPPVQAPGGGSRQPPILRMIGGFNPLGRVISACGLVPAFFHSPKSAFSAFRAPR